MVLLGRVCSHRLSVQNTVVSGTICPQFAMLVLTGVVSPKFGGRGGRRGLEMGPLSSPVVTSYRQAPHSSHRPISLFSQCLTCHGWMHGQNWSSKKWH